MKLTWHPHAQFTYRPDGSLQCGVPPADCLHLRGWRASDDALLGAFDRPRTVRQVTAHLAGEPGGSNAQRISDVVAVLVDAGVLVPEQTLPTSSTVTARQLTDLAGTVDPARGSCITYLRRRRVRVAVVGLSPTGRLVATGLAASGVGDLLVHDPRSVTVDDLGFCGYPTSSLGRVRHAVVAEQAGADAQWAPRPVTKADVTIAVTHRSVLPRQAYDQLLARGGSVLPVVVGHTSTQVGPFSLPGHPGCVRCLDLHLTDDDTDWPFLRDQLLNSSAIAEGTTSALLVAGFAVAKALHLIDTAHDPGGLARLAARLWQVDHVSGEPTESQVTPHPRCRCQDATPPQEGTDAPPAPVGGMMGS